MCAKGRYCQKPKQLKGKPQDCSPEQVKKCHGPPRDHPCVTKRGKEARRRK